MRCAPRNPPVSVLIKRFCDGVGVPGVPQSPPDKRVLRCGACPESTSSGPDKRVLRWFRGTAPRGLQKRFPNTGTMFEASVKSASLRLQIRFPNTGTVLEASLKLASIRLQIRFPNTGTGFEAEETRDFKILNGRVTMRSCAGSAAGHAMQPAEF